MSSVSGMGGGKCQICISYHISVAHMQKNKMLDSQGKELKMKTMTKTSKRLQQKMDRMSGEIGGCSRDIITMTLKINEQVDCR